MISVSAPTLIAKPSSDGQPALLAQQARRPAVAGREGQADQQPRDHGATAWGSGSPVSPAIRLSMAMSAILPRVPMVALPTWGTMVTLGSLSSGSLGGQRFGIGHVERRPRDHAA